MNPFVAVSRSHPPQKLENRGTPSPGPPKHHPLLSDGTLIVGRQERVSRGVSWTEEENHVDRWRWVCQGDAGGSEHAYGGWIGCRGSAIEDHDTEESQCQAGSARADGDEKFDTWVDFINCEKTSLVPIS